MTGIDGLGLSREAIKIVAQKYGATHVRVFGSFARGEERTDSDLDLLVEMDSTRTLLDTIGLIQDLEDQLGRKVDVITVASLHHVLRDRILQEALAL